MLPAVAHRRRQRTLFAGRAITVVMFGVAAVAGGRAGCNIAGCNISGWLYDWRVVREVSSAPQPLEAVYRSSWLALTRLAYLLVGDRSEAEDVVQSVFATAAARWETISDPLAYLRRGVVNRANDVHRQSFRSAATIVRPDRSIDGPECVRTERRRGDRTAAFAVADFNTARRRSEASATPGSVARCEPSGGCVACFRERT